MCRSVLHVALAMSPYGQWPLAVGWSGGHISNQHGEQRIFH